MVVNRAEEEIFTGDVDFDSVKKVSQITPVLRSVSPMTITMFLEHTIKVAK